MFWVRWKCGVGVWKVGRVSKRGGGGFCRGLFDLFILFFFVGFEVLLRVVEGGS